MYSVIDGGKQHICIIYVLYIIHRGEVGRAEKGSEYIRLVCTHKQCTVG